MTDHSSLSNFSDVACTHLKLNLSVDFKKRILHGVAVYTAEVKTEGAEVLVLDTSTLVIASVELDGKKTKFWQRPEHAIFGSALEIQLTGASRAVGTQLTVRIVYHSSRRSTAVQWLPPAQTAGEQTPLQSVAANLTSHSANVPLCSVSSCRKEEALPVHAVPGDPRAQPAALPGQPCCKADL